ncbi:MAG: hypothetical protein JST54_17110 [Deltaproteobacteria bacterium]|nr:hypothetical protein [Deltaproteobacteria bacterium]
MDFIPIWEVLSPDECLPLVIGARDSSNGGRIGGMPPRGVRPPEVLAATHYFATVAISRRPALELSLFTSLDPWGSSEVEGHGVLYDERSKLVQFVIHAPSPRLSRSSLRAAFSGHALKTLAKRDDPPFEVAARTSHKIGGFPYFYDQRFTERWQAVIAKGFLPALQFTFPSGNDPGLPSGNFPFFNSMLNIFSKRTPRGLAFRYMFA